MPKKNKKLPIVLSIKEVLLLLKSTKNLKYRVVIAMLYGSGLKIGNIINLKSRCNLSDCRITKKM